MDLDKKLSIISEAPSKDEQSLHSSPQCTLHSFKTRKTLEKALELISEEDQEFDYSQASYYGERMSVTLANKTTMEQNYTKDHNHSREENIEALIKSKIIKNNNCSCTCQTF